MDAVRKAIKKIRKLHPPLKTEKAIDVRLVEALGDVYAEEFWERDKRVVREQNFKKALIALEQKREAQEAERERQERIAEERLKNLKKARRALKRSRNELNTTLQPG